MTFRPLLSVITVCKNELFIEATCESVCAQTNRDFEWIVIDGASDNQTLQVLEKYKREMNVFISEPDGGVYEAMNKGIARARGKYLLFMNGGDLFYQDSVVEQVMPSLEKGSAGVYYGESYRLFERPEDCFIKTYPDNLKKEFFLTNTLAHQSSFIERDLFVKYGNYREDFKIVSDKEKWLKFIDNGVVFEHLPLVCSCFRMNGVSRKQSPQLKAEKKEMLEQYFSKEMLYGTQIQYLQNIFDR